MKLKRRAKYYPDVSLAVIGKVEYKQVEVLERPYPEARILANRQQPSPALSTLTAAARHKLVLSTSPVIFSCK